MLDMREYETRSEARPRARPYSCPFRSPPLSLFEHAFGSAYRVRVSFFATRSGRLVSRPVSVSCSRNLS